MLDKIVPLLSAYATSDFCELVFYPVLCLAFLASVPCIIRSFVRG